MSSTSLMKHKAVITRRKLIITLILVTIFVVTVATGFSSGTSDNTVYTANGERIVMWDELPEGGTPEDYDLLTNLKFAAQKIYTSGYFRGETNGTATANVGLGIKYTQNVHNVRVVKGDTIFSEAISSSSLKNVAEQKYHHGDTILFRPSKSVNGDTATYSDEVVKMSTEAFLAAYGVKPNELTTYCIQPETILSVSDDNVLVKDSANADGSEDGDDNDEYVYPFEVPTTLVADENGIYRFTLVLDTAGSTKYNRNEVRTLASADSNPVFYSVKLTFEIDEYWNPISVTSVQNYDIAIPVLGSMNIWSTLTEEFTDIGKTDGEVPEREFFEAHLDAETGDIPSAGSSASDYLASAFAPYLDGSENLDLAANISINGFDINGLNLSVNIGSPLSVKLKLDPLAIEYSGDKVYITLNELKGYLSTDKFGDLLADPTLSGLLGSLGELPDFDSLLGDDILTTVFEACEMTTTDGVVCIRLPFSLGDKIQIDASLYINDETKSLISIAGNVNALGMEIALDAAPSTSDFPTVDNTYSDLTPLLDFIPDAVNFALNNTYGVSGTVDLYDADITIDELYIDRTVEKDIKVDGKLTVGGIEVSAKLTNGVIYLQIGNIRVKTAISDINSLVGSITELIGGEAIDTNALSGILDSLMPNGSVSDVLSMLKSFEINNSTLAASVNALGTTVDLSLTRGNGTLKSLTASVDALSLNADLDLSTPARREVTVADESSYITPDDLLTYAAPIKNLIKDMSTAQTIELGLSVSVALGETDINVTCDNLTIAFEEDGNIAVSGMLYVLDDVAIEVVYKSNVLYLRMGNVVSGVLESEHNVAVSLDTTTDLKTLNDVLADYLPEYISREISKILVPDNSDDGVSELNKFGLIIDKLKTVASDPTPENIVNGVFGELSALYKNSAAYYLLDMIGMKKSGDDLTLTVNLLGAELALTPVLSDNNENLVGAVASVSTAKSDDSGVTTVNSIGTLRLSIINISDSPVTVSVPDDDFVPVIEYVQLISNALNTFTTATGYDVGDLLGDGDEATDRTLTFEIPTLTSPIVYQEKAVDADGNVLTNENGTAQIANTITINSYDDQSVLKGKIFIPAEGAAEVELEAHVRLSISSIKDTYGDVTLDLYVVDRTAYLRYVEGKDGYGETVSIDFDSVMQILASVMNIVGLGGDEFKDEEGKTLVDRIFGDYNQKIDAKVFESMKIAGFSDIQKMVADLAAAVENVETALGSIKTAWNVVTDSKSIEELGGRLDELSAHFNDAISALKGIKLGDGNSDINIDNDLMKKVLGGIKLGVDTSVEGEKTLYADVNNSLTVGNAPAANGTSYARVAVTQTTDRTKNVIKGIQISNLDVNTSLIDGGITFVAGEPVTITLPDNLFDEDNKNDSYKHMYSDFANIKHLLYDVMNTANLMEFEIGSTNSTAEAYKTDTIHLKLSVGSLKLINFDIHYNIKVKIFTKEELAEIGIPVKDSDPELKTMAYVELLYKDCKYLTGYVIPNCTTRLYFFDDVLYVDGLKVTRKATSISTAPIKCKYTVEQLGNVISSNIGKFLEEFVFYLIPFTRNLTNGFFLDIQGIIIDNVSKETSSDTSNKTIAKIFKKYKYTIITETTADNQEVKIGKHDITIGLKELAGSSALGDINVSLTGASDGDANLLDNYIKSASIDTNLVGSLIEVTLNANLQNVEGDPNDTDRIRSTWTDKNERAFLNSSITSTIPNTTWQEIWA